MSVPDSKGAPQLTFICGGHRYWFCLRIHLFEYENLIEFVCILISSVLYILYIVLFPMYHSTRQIQNRMEKNPPTKNRTLQKPKNYFSSCNCDPVPPKFDLQWLVLTFFDIFSRCAIYLTETTSATGRLKFWSGTNMDDLNEGVDWIKVFGLFSFFLSQHYQHSKWSAYWYCEQNFVWLHMWVEMP